MSEPRERGVEPAPITGAAGVQRAHTVFTAAARALRRSLGSDSGRSYWRRAGSVVLVVAVAVFSWWIESSLTPAASLDNSWAVGLSLAIARGLVFGKQVVFTYGPLGLAAVPRAVSPGTLALGLLGAAAMWLALAALVLR